MPTNGRRVVWCRRSQRGSGNARVVCDHKHPKSLSRATTRVVCDQQAPRRPQGHYFPVCGLATAVRLRLTKGKTSCSPGEVVEVPSDPRDVAIG